MCRVRAARGLAILGHGCWGPATSLQALWGGVNTPIFNVSVCCMLVLIIGGKEEYISIVDYDKFVSRMGGGDEGDAHVALSLLSQYVC